MKGMRGKSHDYSLSECPRTRADLFKIWKSPVQAARPVLVRWRGVVSHAYSRRGRRNLEILVHLARNLRRIPGCRRRGRSRNVAHPIFGTGPLFRRNSRTLLFRRHYTNGAGTFLVYNTVTVGDGSVLLYKATGTTAIEGTTSRFQGTVDVLGGKGKYEGAKGDGTLTGARPVPLAVGADLYNDLVINIKK